MLAWAFSPCGVVRSRWLQERGGYLLILEHIKKGPRGIYTDLLLSEVEESEYHGDRHNEQWHNGGDEFRSG